MHAATYCILCVRVLSIWQGSAKTKADGLMSYESRTETNGKTSGSLAPTQCPVYEHSGMVILS